MPNLSDKDLDRLSREAAERYEPDEEISSWEKLEPLLGDNTADKPPASWSRFRTRPFVFGSLIIVLAGASYFLFKTGHYSTHSTLINPAAPASNTVSNKTADRPSVKNNAAASSGASGHSRVEAAPAAGSGASSQQSTANAVEKNSHPASEETVNNSGGTQKQSAAFNDKNHLPATGSMPSNNRSAANSDNNKNIAANNHKAVPNNALRNRNSLHPTSPHNLHTGTGHPYAASNREPNSNNKKNNKSGKNGKQVSATGDEDQPAINGSTVQSNNNAQPKSGHDAAEEGAKYAILPGLHRFGNFYGVSDSSLRKLGVTTNSGASEAPQHAQINRALRIGLLFAPDYTNVRSADNNKMSTNFGLTIGYEFASRWSVNTGIIYTKKYYSVNGEDFHAHFPPGYKVDFVKGNCSMLEIPLSLRYDFSRTKKNAFFVNGGLSSYLMQHEDYTYTFHVDNWSPPIWGTASQSYKSHENYILSIASLSVGMEHQFSKNFSLQVEPFIKVPLTGVGLGSLQLNSYGISFSLRYAPVLSRTRR